MKYDYEVLPRPTHLGGGWQLRLMENNIEVGGGVFPAEGAEGAKEAHIDATNEGEEWLSTRAEPDR